MIALSKLSKSYGGRTLFEDVSLQLNVRSRYGLVGANGAGKSTLMRVIAGDEAATDGVVSMAKHARVGVLRQDHFLDDGEIILRLAMMGDSAAWQLLEERALILDGGANADPMRLADIEHGLLNFDGYTLEARATHILEGLGIPIGSHRSPLSSLSGGFKLRVLLAQVLVAGPDILLLDEPTNLRVTRIKIVDAASPLSRQEKPRNFWAAKPRSRKEFKGCGFALADGFRLSCEQHRC